jgi:hypothetical protein
MVVVVCVCVVGLGSACMSSPRALTDQGTERRDGDGSTPSSQSEFVQLEKLESDREMRRTIKVEKRRADGVKDRIRRYVRRKRQEFEREGLSIDQIESIE